MSECTVGVVRDRASRRERSAVAHEQDDSCAKVRASARLEMFASLLASSLVGQLTCWPACLMARLLFWGANLLALIACLLVGHSFPYLSLVCLLACALARFPACLLAGFNWRLATFIYVLLACSLARLFACFSAHLFVRLLARVWRIPCIYLFVVLLLCCVV